MTWAFGRESPCPVNPTPEATEDIPGYDQGLRIFVDIC